MRPPKNSSVLDFLLTLSRSDRGAGYRVTLQRRCDSKELAVALLPLFDIERLREKYLRPLHRFIDDPFPHDCLVALGTKLAELLLPPLVQQALFAELLRRPDPTTPLRLRLKVTPSELSDLPWEFVYFDRPSPLPTIKGFLALHRNIHLVRQPLPPTSIPPITADALSVLIAWADPRSAEYPALLGLADEVRSILAAPRSPECRRVAVEELRHATPAALQRRLTEQPPHILHFLGHGDVRGLGGRLVLEGAQPGEEAIVYGDDLARWLSGTSVRLVVLSACLTGLPMRGVAETLAMNGVPAVVAMQLPLRDATAGLFARAFYGALVTSTSVENAVSEGRQAVQGAGPDWGVPVLYLTSESSDLFQLPDTALSQPEVSPPTGTVTLLFTDIQDSTQHWAQLKDQFQSVKRRHDALLRDIAQRWGGYEVQTTGDGFFFAFSRPSDAIRCAIEMQIGLSQEAWGKDLAELRVRIGMHTGEPFLSEDGGRPNYDGPAPNLSERIMSAGHGGQILVSNTTRKLVQPLLPPDITFRDLGVHRLKGVGEERLWQVCHPDLSQEFPPLRIPSRALEAELERLRQELIREGQHRRQLQREAIVGLRFVDVSDVFKDREDKIAELRRLLTDQTVKLICVVGRGGVGKTALLSKVCTDIESGELRLSDAAMAMGADGIIYISCRGTDKPTVERLFHDVGRVLGNPQAGELTECWKDASRSLADKVRFLLSKLRDGCYLLVLDNLEDALAPDNTIADTDLRTFVELCLATPHALRLIATSRERVVVGAQSVRAARTVSLDTGLPNADAIALLRDLDPDGELGLRDAPDDLLQDAARRCYGVPRALETIAGILSSDPTLTIAQLLNDVALFNEQVVENLIAEHYRRVSDDQRRVLEALSVYNKPVPAAAVRYFLLPFFPNVDVDDCLRALVRNHFVTHHRGRSTYELHPLDRQHAYARIPDGGSDYTQRACHRRAAKFYAELRKPTEEWKTIADLQPQLDEFEHRVRAGDYDYACYLLNTIDFDHLMVWGHSELTISMRTRLIGHLTGCYFEFLNWTLLGYAYNRLWLAEDAIRCLKRALEMSEAARQERMIGDLTGNIGRALMLVGQIDKAISLFDKALQTTRGDPFYEVLLTGRQGEALQRLGRTEEALDCYKLALVGSQRIGDTRWQVTHLSNAGDVYRQLGDMDTAIQHLQEGLHLSSVTGNRQGEGFCLMRLGQAYYDSGKLDEARGYYERSLQTGFPPCNFMCAVKLGILCLEEDKAEEARGYFTRGIAFCRALLEKTPRLYEALYHLALAQLGMGQPDETLSTYRRALEVCSAKGVVQSARHDLRLMERAAQPVAGIEEAIALLEERQR